MENNLDRLFRENLSERQFEFKNEYWQAAEKLLDADKRRRRRALIFWWLGGATMLVTVAVAVTGIGFGTENQPLPAIDKLENQAATATGKTENQAVARENTKPAQSGDAILPGGITSANLPQTGSASAKSKTSDANSVVVNEPLSSTGAPKTSIAKTRTPPTTRKSSAPGQIFQAPAAGSTKIAPGNNPPWTAVSLVSDLPAETAKNSALSAPAKSPEDQKTEAQTKPQANNEIRQPIDLQSLPSLKIAVAGDFSKKPKTTGNPKIQPHSPFRLGVVVGQIFQVQPDSGEQTILGWHVGLALQRDFGKGWFVATGLEYLRRDGHFDASKSAERVNYRFGREAETQILRPTSLHYLALPLKLGWQQGHHVIETGGDLNYLLGLRGEIGTLERVGDQKIFKPSQKGWLVEDGFKKWHLNASLGYRYRVNRQLSLGVAANYSLGGILEKDYVHPLLNGYVLRETDKFLMSANAVYFLK